MRLEFVNPRNTWDDSFVHQKNKRLSWQIVDDDEDVWEELNYIPNARTSPQYRSAAVSLPGKMSLLIGVSLGFLLGIGADRHNAGSEQVDTITATVSQSQTKTAVDMQNPTSLTDTRVQRPSRTHVKPSEYELSEAQCLVISLYYREGYSANEIVAQFGLPLGQVNQHLHKE